MSILANYSGEVRFVRSSFTSKNGATLVLALPDLAELEKVQGMDGKRYMLALVEIGDDEQPAQQVSTAILEKPKGGALAKLAGLWCNDAQFIKWLGCKNSIDAAATVRQMCGIDSRSELDSDLMAEEKFQALIRGPYMKFLGFSGMRLPA